MSWSCIKWHDYRLPAEFAPLFSMIHRVPIIIQNISRTTMSAKKGITNKQQQTTLLNNKIIQEDNYY